MTSKGPFEPKAFYDPVILYHVCKLHSFSKIPVAVSISSQVPRKSRHCGAQAFQQPRASSSVQGFPHQQPRVILGIQQNHRQDGNAKARLNAAPGFHERAEPGDPGMGGEHVPSR